MQDIQQPQSQPNMTVESIKAFFRRLSYNFKNNKKYQGITIAVIDLLVVAIVGIFLMGNRTYEYADFSFESPVALKEDRFVEIPGMDNSENEIYTTFVSKDEDLYVRISYQNPDPKEMEEYKTTSLALLKKVLEDRHEHVMIVDRKDNFFYGGIRNKPKGLVVYGYIIFDFNCNRVYYVNIISNSKEALDKNVAEKIFKSAKFHDESLYTK